MKIASKWNENSDIIVIKPHSAVHVIIFNLFPATTLSLSARSSSLDFLLKMRRSANKKTGQSNSIPSVNSSAADLFRSGTLSFLPSLSIFHISNSDYFKLRLRFFFFFFSIIMLVLNLIFLFWGFSPTYWLIYIIFSKLSVKTL